jgi:hypothetical protein
MTDYFPRRLRIFDGGTEGQLVDEDELLATTGAKVVLGEPGMGKSKLMREVGRRLGVVPISAARFINSIDPSRFVSPGKPIIIDALDEAMARREGDVVDVVIAQLEESGSPEFVLSCRSREWQSRNLSTLGQPYDSEPKVFALEPLSRSDAQNFLALHYCNVDPDHVLNHLDTHGLAELYGNPLTLGLIGQVARRDANLPRSRAALFERVCMIIWPEHDPDRDDTQLAQATDEEALSAAGGISAALLFSGAEAISAAGRASVHERDIRLADLEALPGTATARAIFSSKLFSSVGTARATPVHRVIAEYLGARWLAQEARNPRTIRRLLGQFRSSGGVPASLRGLHACLAHHSPAMAEQVIMADPYGVLRYGETASLTLSQADCLLEALRRLGDEDPYFRASDWDRHTAAGLMVPALRDKIGDIIGSTDSNAHLRSLLIESLKEVPLTADLALTLEKIVVSDERNYSEREDAAEALLPHRERGWWQQTIADLRDQGTENAARLARTIIASIDCDVSDDLLVSTLFIEMGATISLLPRREKREILRVRIYDKIVKALPTTRLVKVLNCINEYCELVDANDWQSWNDVGEIVAVLFVRAIDEVAVSPGDAAAMWNWLGVYRHSTGDRSQTKELRVRLAARTDLRQAVQLHALYDARSEESISASAFELDDRMVGLTRDDLIFFLERLAKADNSNADLRQEWKDLMQLGMRGNELDPELRAAGAKFQRSDEKLKHFVDSLLNPEEPEWQRWHRQKAADHERERRARREAVRADYSRNREALRSGELKWILGPAQAYLGLFNNLERDQPAVNRIGEWLGPELQDDAMAGLEAVLHRTDLPTPVQVAQGFADERRYRYRFPIVAGLLAKCRSAKELTDLSDEVLKVALLSCHGAEQLSCDDEDLASLCGALEALVISTEKDREDFARLWIEPSLKAGKSHVIGLYKLAHDDEWRVAGRVLAREWLDAFPDVPEHVELELVDCLTDSRDLTPLASIAASRASIVFRNFDHMLAWLAIDVLARFNTVIPAINGIGSKIPEFIWFLRNRSGLERRNSMAALSVDQLKWIIAEFRQHWPNVYLHGSSSGDTNDHNAAEFIRSLISRLANDTSEEAEEAIQALVAEPVDTYSNWIMHMAAEQRQKRVEENYVPLMPQELGALLRDGPPTDANDLRSLVLDELEVAQKKLIGDDLDQVRDFLSDNGLPYDENRCRDRLAVMIEPGLTRYDVQRITEADMPRGKRVDLAFSHGGIQLPMEIKGQWHEEVWSAAKDQLDALYLIDWRSDGRGIYCVLWFGEFSSKSGRRLKAPPNGLPAPNSPEEMREMLIQLIPESRRTFIEVVVLDLTSGRS